MIEIVGLRTIPEIKPGDDLGQIIYDSIKDEGLKLACRDALVVTQKIVSKAEGRVIRLSEVKPSTFAEQVAKESGRDPRLIEVILRESKRIVRMRGPHLIAEHRLGLVMANAGVDQSNVGVEDAVTLLPENPDLSAYRIRTRIKELSGVDVAVIISDTSGRPFRLGQINLAIGSSGITPIRSYRGQRDMFGRPLTITAIAVVDELASAAELVMNKSDHVPVALIRGYSFRPSLRGASSLSRPISRDLFA